MATDIGGVWRTVGGRRIFIKDGEDLSTAMNKSGKFKKNGIKKEVKSEKIIVYHGSQYDFDKFDMEKSKENNQWTNNLEGHYFAEDKEFASEYGKYLYEVELSKDKTQRTGSFWEPETKEFYVSKDDNDIKIIHKYKVDNSIKTKNISDNIKDYEKKLNSLNKLSKEWKEENAKVDWEHINNDKKEYEQTINELKKQYKELSEKKYKKIF